MRRSTPRPNLRLTVALVVLPLVTILASGVLGTSLPASLGVVGTVGIFLFLLLGLPVGMWLMIRPQLRQSSGGARRLPSWRQLRPPPLHDPPLQPRPRLAPAYRAAAWLVVAVMFVGSFSMWTVIPLGWIWVGSQLAETTQPETIPYLVVLVGIPLTAALVVRGLADLAAVHTRLVTRAEAARRRAGWLVSVTDARKHRGVTTAERVFVSSVLVALACLFVWFLFFAEMQSMLHSYMD